MSYIDDAVLKFRKILEAQSVRVEKMKEQGEFVDFTKLDKITVGICPGDGIGVAITREAKRIVEVLLKNEIASGKIILKDIEGLTIENRMAVKKAIPDDVLAELKKCDVILKGPTETPRKEEGVLNIESANVKMRKELDLFANVRPVKVKELGIDWTFFRENTEGAYALGSDGFDVNDDIAMDFTVATTEGTERIIRTAFEFAKNNGKKRVTAVTKANVIKTTDGKFLKIFYEMAKEYPDIKVDDWYIDIMTAKLIDEKRRNEFEVLVLPNLYGDILTDEAAEIQGGVGTAGSANIGKKYAMFEAIHGSAPRMVSEGRAQYADPASIIKAAAMLLRHIGYNKQGDAIDEAIAKIQNEKIVVMTGRSNGATVEEFGNKVLEYVMK